MALLSSELLAQARGLARREPRRPKQASLRRSISAAYYALFHFLIEEATKLTVGTGHHQTELRRFAGRAFVHGKMKAVCEEFKKTQPQNKLLSACWSSMGFVTNGDLRTLATNFIEAQEKRHKADYDLALTFTRQEAETTVSQVEDAIQAWKNLKNNNAPLAQFFVLSLTLWPGLSGR